MILAILFKPFSLHAPKSFWIILFSNLSTVSVLDERVVVTKFAIYSFVAITGVIPLPNIYKSPRV